jgi:NAD+ synthase (glutamine-hydrolysing)
MAQASSLRARRLMRNRFRLALAQINTTVGDIGGNEVKIIRHIQKARKLGVDVVAFPELSMTGYPPEDLLLKPQFITDNLASVRRIADRTKGITAVVGFADAGPGRIHNAAAVIHAGKLAGVYHKIYLPNYGVFDERRYFTPGNRAVVLVLGGVRIGLNICEDIWIPEGVADFQALRGEADIILNISSSPYHAGKGRQREVMLSSRARKNRTVVAYVNLVGGQDELVFDGMSLVYGEQGELLARGKQFEEDLIVVDLDVAKIRRSWHGHKSSQREKTFDQEFDIQSIVLPAHRRTGRHGPLASPSKQRLSPLAEIYQALVLGTRDYVQKNGFGRVVIGLSGGIDSALTAAIAADALGRENVLGITMPSPYSSTGSVTDSQRLAANLGIGLQCIPISAPFAVTKSMLKESFVDRPEDETEENIQARIRGLLLMAYSNKFGWLVLAPGNKSEISMGYCTLYGTWSAVLPSSGMSPRHWSSSWPGIATRWRAGPSYLGP